MAILLDGDMMQAENDPELNDIASDDPLHEDGQPSETLLEKMREEADKLIGKFLADNVQNIFSKDKISEGLEKALVSFAPRGLFCSPTSNPNNQVYRPVQIDSVEEARYFLRTLVGEFAEKLDIYDDEYAGSENFYLDYVTDYDKLKGILSGYKTTAHAYSVVLGMKPQLRDLPAIALGRNPPSQSMFYTRSEEAKASLRSICIPSTKDMLLVAKEYNFTQVGDVFQEMKEVVRQYDLKWK